MNRQELTNEIMDLAAKAEASKEPYIAEGLRQLSELIEENCEGTYVTLLTFAKKYYKQLVSLPDAK